MVKIVSQPDYDPDSLDYADYVVRRAEELLAKEARTMREIRFRGKEHTGEWITGGYVQKNGAPHIVAHIVDRGVDEWRAIPVIPATVGQFTGLRDAKGVEIYEGDIIRWMDPISGEALSGVVLYERRGCFCVTNGRQLDPSCPLYLGGPIIECLGNVHDAPELLKK